MKELLVRFAQRFTEFRIPELESVATLLNTKVSYPEPHAVKLASSLEPEDETPFLQIQFESIEAAKAIGSRSISIKAIYEIWGVGNSLEEAVISTISNHPNEEQERLFVGQTFHFKIDSFGRHYSREEQIQLLKKTDSLKLWEVSKVKIHKPQHCFCIIEDHGPGGTLNSVGIAHKPLRILLCKKVASGSRSLIDSFSLRKRGYLGSTTMNPELAFFMANQALARKGSICYDPFTGTGGIALACAKFGSLVFGSDISSPTLHGTEKGKSVLTNFSQYQLSQNLLGLAVLDQARSPIRKGMRIFDAIVCDPPYGVRAGARKVGQNEKQMTKEEIDAIHKLQQQRRENGEISFPHCVPYGVPEMLRDLLCSSAQMLKIGGRLVFWMPSTVEYRESDLPKHPCFKLISNSLQQITLRWGRRLITFEKCVEFDPLRHSTLSEAELGQVNPSHKDFSEFVFSPEDHIVETDIRNNRSSTTTTAATTTSSTTSLDPRMIERLKQKGRKKAAQKKKQTESKKPESKQQQQQQSQPPSTTPTIKQSELNNK